MLFAYINYPNPKVSVHLDPGCSAIHVMHKAGQRNIRINLDNLSDELRRFADKQYRFRATPEFNDMWLEIDFNDAVFELAVLRHVHQLVAGHYGPLSRIEPVQHCSL